ncbi:helix-hairpin-helix domain-containing protein [Ornithinibacillus halophilus]|uniref:Competence protein ComEA n=1 Tax=Ornithinibacillus halophilus TaxID=930117 RepID=A0A1M5DKB0_9BACI|nr:helix-hairpin-helix domain-containing protein [Ornithinibacillus halophilus]SHF67439.1 competence protein ComEA [Ornithinibacillus halophilus]
MIEFIKKYAIVLLVGFVIVILLVINVDRKTEVSELTTVEEISSTINSSETSPVASTQKILVDIKGSVRHPGVYEMNEEDRVIDVLEKAGGFTENAEETVINLAQKVYDEMIIIVPNKGEQTASSTGVGGTSKIRLNHASVEEIQSLTGIGPSKAQAIIQYREENGPFKSVDELLNVSGIGEKTLEAIREDIHVP